MEGSPDNKESFFNADYYKISAEPEHYFRRSLLFIGVFVIPTIWLQTMIVL